MIEINHQINDPDAIKLLNELGKLIGGACEPLGLGFNLLLFDFGEKGNLFYISNAKREDIINVMKEFIARNTQ